nr:uncharacterized protein CTRU02_15557 [Colletotrichum truncatum]KAF6780936.1 hypothetical protein CTRU02_15557 [Colletotrichum truncatum]
MCKHNTAVSVEDIPVSQLRRGKLERIPWCLCAHLAMFRHFARHKPDCEYPALVYPRVQRALEAKFVKLGKKGTIVEGPDKTCVWSPWTALWAHPDWDGEIEPPPLPPACEEATAPKIDHAASRVNIAPTSKFTESFDPAYQSPPPSTVSAAPVDQDQTQNGLISSGIATTAFEASYVPSNPPPRLAETSDLSTTAFDPSQQQDPHPMSPSLSQPSKPPQSSAEPLRLTMRLRSRETATVVETPSQDPALKASLATCFPILVRAIDDSKHIKFDAANQWLLRTLSANDAAISAVTSLLSSMNNYGTAATRLNATDISSCKNALAQCRSAVSQSMNKRSESDYNDTRVILQQVRWLRHDTAVLAVRAEATGIADTWRVREVSDDDGDEAITLSNVTFRPRLRNSEIDGTLEEVMSVYNASSQAGEYHQRLCGSSYKIMVDNNTTDLAV